MIRDRKLPREAERDPTGAEEDSRTERRTLVLQLGWKRKKGPRKDSIKNNFCLLFGSLKAFFSTKNTRQKANFPGTVVWITMTFLVIRHSQWHSLKSSWGLRLQAASLERPRKNSDMKDDQICALRVKAQDLPFYLRSSGLNWGG